MSLKYERRLLEHLKHDDFQPAPADKVAEELGVPTSEREDFRAAVDDLVGRKVIVRDSSARIQLPKMGEEVTGSFKKNQKGFGFVITDTPFREGDLFVPPDATLNALTGDKVRVAVVRGQRRGESDTTGEVIEILSRKRTNFVGELIQRGGLWVVMPDGRELTQPIVVKDPTIKNAHAGDKVSVEITAYPEGNALAEGVIVKVLGEAGLPDVETQATIAAYNLPGEFTRECVQQAREAAKKFDEDVAAAEAKGFDPHERLDLRETFICTIDPPDAKDYDDAISLFRREDGGWDLGVHIADVASFIPPDSALDEEARERGNSVYLPRMVIPMLPEVLSNGICSLAEGVVRYCKSAFMTYDADGHIKREWCANTAIKSAKRLTYLEAQALIDGDLHEARKHAKTEPKYTDQLIKTLREMDKCARAIRDRRRRAGMIHLELPEVNLIFDDAGHVIDAEPEDNAFTHTIIEMLMVEANEVLARLFEGMDVPLLRRVHPEPTPGNVGELRTMARVAGYTIPKNPTLKELQSLLDATAGTGAARAVHMAVLRTLTKAEYSPAPIGHFALASSAYAHFTSPIRRYPDLTVHRALAAYLKLTDNGKSAPGRSEQDRKRLGDKLERLGAEAGVLGMDELVEIGRNCSRTEVNAADAERSLRQFLVLQLLSNHIGESFAGIVTGVMPSGVFVQLEKYLAEGMVKTADLPGGRPAGLDSPGKLANAWNSGGSRGGGSSGGSGGRWSIDPRSGALVHSSGRSFNMGDQVQVTIAAIDLAARRMELVIADARSREVGKGKKPPPEKAGAGLGGGGLAIDWDELKSGGRTGADNRAQRSKSRERGKQDYRKDRKDKGKR